MRSVEAFKRTVKNTIEKAREPVMIYGYHFHFSPIDPARITGKTGSTHGARIVSIPAINETNASENIDKNYFIYIESIDNIPCTNGSLVSSEYSTSRQVRFFLSNPALCILLRY
jgi:hypothetical protein